MLRRTRFRRASRQERRKEKNPRIWEERTGAAKHTGHLDELNGSLARIHLAGGLVDSERKTSWTGNVGDTRMAGAGLMRCAVRDRGRREVSRMVAFVCVCTVGLHLLASPPRAVDPARATLREGFNRVLRLQPFLRRWEKHREDGNETVCSCKDPTVSRDISSVALEL